MVKSIKMSIIIYSIKITVSLITLLNFVNFYAKGQNPNYIDSRIKNYYNKEIVISNKINSKNINEINYLVADFQFFQQKQIDKLVLCRNLKVIDLSHTSNYIISDVFRIINKMPNLQCLILDNRRIDSVYFTQLKNSKLLFLSMVNCGVKYFDSSITNLTNLKELYLGGGQSDFYRENTLIPFPVGISKLKTLKTLTISSSSLNDFPIEIIGLINLEKLYMSYNNIKVIPTEIMKLENLEVIGIDNNKFTEFPQQLLSVKSLNIIFLENNDIKSLPKEICILQNIKKIYLAGCDSFSIKKSMPCSEKLIFE